MCAGKSARSTAPLGWPVRADSVASMIWILALLLGLWGPGMMAQEPASTLADQVLMAVQRADQARQRLADEQAAWQAEAARLEALVALIDQQATALEAQAERDGSAAAELRQEAAPPAAEPVAAIEDLLRAEAAAFAQALAARQAQLPPDLTPDQTRAPQTKDDALTLWADALRRWRSLVASADGWGLSLEDARDAAGQPRAVHVLRAGSAALWWLAVDDAEAGMARIEDGQLRLLAPVAASDAAAIRAAVAMVRGRRTPGLLLLPFPALPLVDQTQEPR